MVEMSAIINAATPKPLWPSPNAERTPTRRMEKTRINRAKRIQKMASCTLGSPSEPGIKLMRVSAI